MPYIGTSPSNGVRRVFTYTATASQTTFSGASNEGSTLAYVDNNYLDVFQNGILLGSADYTSTNGTSVVLAQAASVDDIIVIIAYDVFSVADTVSKTDGGTFDGNVAMGGTLAVTGNQTNTGSIAISSADSASFLATDTTNNAQATLFADNNNAHVGSMSNHNVVFRQNNTEKLRLTTNGLLGTDFFMQFPPSTPISHGGAGEVAYYQNGALTSTDASLGNSPVPQAITVLKMRLYVNNSLSGGGARVYVQKNGSIITGANKEIDVTTGTFAFEANAVNTDFSAGDRIGVRIMLESGASAAWYHVVLLCRMTIA
jgi:hypothetical protein